MFFLSDICTEVQDMIYKFLLMFFFLIGSWGMELKFNMNLMNWRNSLEKIGTIQYRQVQSFSFSNRQS